MNAEPRTTRALLHHPSAVQQLHELALSFLRRGELSAATGWLLRALRVDSKDFDARVSLGVALESSGRAIEASVSFWAALALRPESAIAWFNLGNAMNAARNFEAASAFFSRAIAVNPDFALAWVNLADTAVAEVGVRRATEFCEIAMIVDPGVRGAYLGQFDFFGKRGDFDLAHKAFRRADALSSCDGDLCMNAASQRLSAGDFMLGWLYYERRWVSAASAPMAAEFAGLRRSRPVFIGPPTSLDKRVLVWAEQGVGDEVMFGGLVGEFRGLCGELLLQVDRRLMGLFERALPGVRVFERGKPVPSELYDEQIPMGSLGKWLRPSRESFEGKGGRYLKAQEGLGRRLRAELGVGASEKLIGLSWRSASAETGAARSLSLKALVGALQGVEGARFLNLQYGEVSEELRALREETGVAVLTHPGIDNREDLEGLAGLIEGCDLVVSVGNATAHLSGALGQKTWVLLPYVAGWRWLHEGERCPWYQSVRLYRQSKPGDWTQPLQRVCHALTAGH
jgi:Tfp pilus assembly protein PilF